MQPGGISVASDGPEWVDGVVIQRVQLRLAGCAQLYDAMVSWLDDVAEGRPANVGLLVEALGTSGQILDTVIDLVGVLPERVSFLSGFSGEGIPVVVLEMIGRVQ